jgi:hypothetical protein
MVAEDFDGDGNLDIVISTNDYGTDPNVGRYDALNGLVLQGDGKGGFVALNMLASGINIPGNGKALIKIMDANKQSRIIASQNRGPLQVYQPRIPVVNIPFNSDDAYAMLTLTNGKKQRVEHYFGSSFLSQSCAFVSISKNVTNVDIVNNKGLSRKAF